MRALSTVPPANSEGSHIANELVAEFGPLECCVAISEEYMTNRVTTFLLIVSASLTASASIASMLVSTASAADECLTKPKAETPQGQHWYYRSDRTTKRQCWYLRDKDDTSSQAAVAAPPEEAAPSDRKNEMSLGRTTADAYAALSSPEGRFEGSLPIPPAAQTPSIDAKAVEQDPWRDAAPSNSAIARVVTLAGLDGRSLA